MPSIGGKNKISFGFFEKRKKKNTIKGVHPLLVWKFSFCIEKRKRICSKKKTHGFAKYPYKLGSIIP